MYRFKQAIELIQSFGNTKYLHIKVLKFNVFSDDTALCGHFRCRTKCPRKTGVQSSKRSLSADIVHVYVLRIKGNEHGKAIGALQKFRQVSADCSMLLTVQT